MLTMDPLYCECNPGAGAGVLSSPGTAGGEARAGYGAGIAGHIAQLSTHVPVYRN